MHSMTMNLRSTVALRHLTWRATLRDWSKALIQPGVGVAESLRNMQRSAGSFGDGAVSSSSRLTILMSVKSASIAGNVADVGWGRECVCGGYRWSLDLRYLIEEIGD